MADVSQVIQTHKLSSSGFGERSEFTLASGGVLATGDQKLTVHSINTTSSDGLTSMVFQNTTSIIDFYTFFISNKTGDPTLLETSLQLCAQTVNTTVINGSTQTLELSRSTTLSHTDHWQISIPGDSNTYAMGEYSFRALTNFLATIFQGSYSVDASGTINYDTDIIEVLVDTLLIEPYDQEAMANFLNSFTISMTNS